MGQKNIDIQGIYPENIFSFWIISKEFYEFLRAKEKHIENQEDKYFLEILLLKFQQISKVALVFLPF